MKTMFKTIDIEKAEISYFGIPCIMQDLLKTTECILISGDEKMVALSCNHQIHAECLKSFVASRHLDPDDLYCPKCSK